MRSRVLGVLGGLLGIVAGSAVITGFQAQAPTAPMRWIINTTPAIAQGYTYRVYIDGSNTPAFTLAGVVCTASSGNAACSGTPAAPGWPLGNHSFVLGVVSITDSVASPETRSDAFTMAIAPGAPPKPTGVTIGGGEPPPPPPPPDDSLGVTLAVPGLPLTGARVDLAMVTQGPVTRVVVDVMTDAGAWLCAATAQRTAAGWSAPLYPSAGVKGAYRLKAVAFDAAGGRAESAIVQVTVG